MGPWSGTNRGRGGPRPLPDPLHQTVSPTTSSRPPAAILQIGPSPPPDTDLGQRPEGGAPCARPRPLSNLYFPLFLYCEASTVQPRLLTLPCSGPARPVAGTELGWPAVPTSVMEVPGLN